MLLRRWIAAGLLALVPGALVGCSGSPNTVSSREEIETLVDSRVRIALARLNGERRLDTGEKALGRLLSDAGRQARELAATPADDATRESIEALAAGIEGLGSQLEETEPAALDFEELERRLVSSMDDLRSMDGTALSGGGLFARLSSSLEHIHDLVGQVGEVRDAVASLESGGDEESVDSLLDPWAADGAEEWAVDDWPSPGDDDGPAAAGRTMEARLATFRPPRTETRKPRGVSPATVSLSSHPSVRVELLSLRRSDGDTVTLTFALTNEGEAKVDLGVDSLFGDASGWSVSKGAFLADPRSHTRYDVLRDSAEQPLCSRGSYDNRVMKPGERRELWARFPAPAGPTVSVHLADVPPFDRVAVEG